MHLGNVILDESREDRIEIIGFGRARVDELVSLTMHTRVLGALETMAPEVVLGKAADAQADIFSVGAMLYELLTGKALHDGRMSSALKFAAGEDYLGAVRARLEGVLKGGHPGLLAAVMRALVPDATLRFATAGQMRDALQGSYDEGIWRALESRKSVRCGQCGGAAWSGWELLDGVALRWGFMVRYRTTYGFTTICCARRSICFSLDRRTLKVSAVLWRLRGC